MKKILFPILRTVISVMFIVILLYIMRDKYGLIITLLKGTRAPVLGLAFLVFILAVSIASLRLKLLIDIQNIRITFREALSLNFIGYFFNNFLPTAVGGDVVKGYYLSKKTKEKMAAFSSVFVDRVTGLITMIFMAFIALIADKNQVMDITIKRSIYAITMISCLALVFVMNKNFAKKFSGILKLVKPLEGKLRKAYNIIHKYKQHKALMFKALAISFISQLLFFVSLGIIAVSIGARIPMLDILLRTPIISALSLLPSINGLGLREGSTVLLFGPLIGKTNAFAVSILWLVILFMISIIGGVIYGISPQFKIKIKEIEGKGIPI